MNGNDQKQILDRMMESVIRLDRANAEKLARQAVTDGLDLHAVIDSGFGRGIRKAGELWEQGDFFLPELMMSAEIMKQAMAIIIPHLDAKEPGARKQVKIVIGTVQGDIHDIGKSLVATMMRATGFQVIDLGADVKLEEFVACAKRESARMICMSALLTTTMLGQKTLIDTLVREGIRDRFLVLVGGAPVTESWAREIGADGFGSNAVSAVSVARSLLFPDA